MSPLSLTGSSGLESLPGLVWYQRQSCHREPEFPEGGWLLREPSSRYARRKPSLGAEQPAAETKPHPFRKDLLWKTISEDLPGEFLRFFFPGIAAGKNPEQKIAFLNKELIQLFPPEDGRFAPQRVDNLLKIPMRNGSAVILHCEVQGNRQPRFSARMYRYFGRLWDKYPRQVTAIAILTDGDPGFRPVPYREKGNAGDDHRLCYRYKCYKVLEQSEEELERSDNPFALVILTTKAALKRANGDYTEEAYFQRKLELAQWLESKPTSETQTQALLSFLKYYLPLEDKVLEDKFDEQLKERSETMGTVEFLMNEAKKEGRGKGRQEEKISFVKSLLANTDFDNEKIAALATVDVNFVSKHRENDKER